MVYNLRSILRAVIILVAGLMLLLYLWAIWYGAALQDQRSPEDITLQRLNRYLTSLGIEFQAPLSSCTRSPNHEIPMSIKFFVRCGVNHVEGYELVSVWTAFGARNQSIFWETHAVEE